MFKRFIFTKKSEDSDPNFKTNRRTFKSIWAMYGTFYLMLLPCIIFFLVFSYWTMTGNILAFREFSFRSGMYGTGFVGLEYFRDFFSDRQTPIMIKNTLVISAIKLFLYLPFPIILALAFNELYHKRSREIYQSISYLPYFISWVVVVGIFTKLFAPNTGLINIVLKSLSLTDGSDFWMMKNSFFYPAIFFTYLWKNVGWDSIIYYASIMGINPSLSLS